MAADDSLSEAHAPDTQAESQRIDLIDRISSDRFSTWYEQRVFRENIQNGKPYFNGPSSTPPPRRQSPSQLLQCHRKTYYRKLNAPAESADPKGIFWIGTQFEEDIALPFLRDAVVDDTHYVTNSIWIDFTEQTTAGDIRIRGETDPVIVDADGNPLFVTEIKTRESVDDMSSPSTHHRAQAHAYMKGLSEQYEQTVTDAILLYGSRKTLDVKAFHLVFDPNFWQRITDWTSTQKTYRLYGNLPPADPEYDWECEFCPYSQRCGKGDKEFSSVGPSGLLPLYAQYPRETIVDYLEAHDGAKLTPTLAHQFPDLAEQYGSYDWRCSQCGSQTAWDAVEWNAHTAKPPACPECDDEYAWLQGPRPVKQNKMEGRA